MYADRREAVSRVMQLIRDAFTGVTLADGIGLFQGQALDAYADEPTQASVRSSDETIDWARISTQQLNECHSSLSFFDGKGMRFHLPAYLLADLNGKLQQDIVFHLTYPADQWERFALLNGEQRRAVEQFLVLHMSLLDKASEGFERPLIEKAIAAFWCHSP